MKDSESNKKGKVESESDESDSDSDSDSDSSDESSDDDDKPEQSDKCTQTTGPPTYEPDSSDSDEDEVIKVEMKDQATETDEIPTEEKGVNTRSRSLQGLSSHRKSPTKEGSDTDNSLAARRRRRRERAQTTTVNYNHSFDTGDDLDGADDNHPTGNTHSSTTTSRHSEMTYPGRKPRSRFLPNHSTLDNGDMYYDAASASSRDLTGSGSHYM